MPLVWKVINFILGFLIFVGILVLGFYYPDIRKSTIQSIPKFSPYAALSMALLGVVFILFWTGLTLFARDNSWWTSQPVFYSPWLMPIYKYQVLRGEVTLNY
jgi:hypothetical protein